MDRPTREEALSILREFNDSDNLVKHGLAVEAVMRHMARLRGHDEEKWGVIGLIHDLDYEKYPEAHCHKTADILRERGWPEDYSRAVQSHGWGLCTEVEPIHEMEKALYAVDELTGLITAVALVRPSKSLMDLTPKSVTKKWKDKSFAAGASREIIQNGIDMLGMERSELIAVVIEGMRAVADDLGLGGTA